MWYAPGRNPLKTGLVTASVASALLEAQQLQSRNPLKTGLVTASNFKARPIGANSELRRNPLKTGLVTARLWGGGALQPPVLLVAIP